MPLSRADRLKLHRLIMAAHPASIPTDPHAAHTASLPEVPKLIYRLHDVEGLCIKEIAGVLAKRPSRVRQALERARGLLAAHATPKLTR